MLHLIIRSVSNVAKYESQTEQITAVIVTGQYPSHVRNRTLSEQGILHHSNKLVECEEGHMQASLGLFDMVEIDTDDTIEGESTS